jgi:HK97 family phage major capsid protein
MSGEVVKRLRERRAQVWEQAKSVADRAADENRAFNGEEQSQWDTLNAELDALDKRIKNVIEGEQRAKDTEEAFAKLEGKPREREQRGEDDQLNNELRSFLRGEGKRTFDVNPSGPVNIRTLSKLTAPAGGHTVPIDFYNQIVEYMIETSAILGAGVTVLNTSGGEEIQVPKATTHSTAAITAEAAAIGVSDPVFAQQSLRAYKYGVLIQVSRELLDDTGFDLQGYLARQAGRAVGNAVGAHLINGDGTNKPRGLLLDTTLGVTGTAGSAANGPTADNLIDLMYSVIAPYRNTSSAAFVVSDAQMGRLRKVKDTTGQYLFQPSLVAGTPDTILGKRIVVDPFVPSGASTRQAAFGDLSAYYARLAGGLRFERSDEYAFNTDLVTFRCLLRADGALMDPNAVKHFVAAAT